MRASLCAVLLAAVACAGGPAEPASAPAPALGGFGRCDADHVDGAPADGFVSRPGAWLRVRRIDVPSDAPRRTTGEFAGEYDVVGGDDRAVAALGGDTVGALRMHGSLAHEAAGALRTTPEVYAHVGEDAKEVEFALALAGEDFAFLGECQDVLLTEPMRDILGPDAAATLRGLVGKTGAEFAAALR